MILYFSGTGNSRYAAQMLGELLDDEVVSINDYLRSGEPGSFESRKPWVFAAPAYVSAPPLVFLDFLRKSSFSGAKEAWFVITCAGGFGACPAYCRDIAAEKGFSFMGTAQLVMPQNYLIYFRTKQPEENRIILENAESRIRELAQYIAQKQEFPDPGMKQWELVSTKMVLSLYYKWFIRAKAFTVSEECIHCGKCVRVCPLNNVRLTDGKPQWGSKCTHCMACINVCPRKAIEYGKRTVGKPRYFCPHYHHDI